MNLIQEIVAKVVYGLVVGSIEPQDVMIDVWDNISSEPRIQSDFLLMYHEYINWDIVSVHHCDFTDDEFEMLHEYLNWDLIDTYRVIPSHILSRYYKVA